MSKIPRNDPCPCGSGLKYKKCCLLKNAAAGPSEMLDSAFAGQQFQSLDDAQVFANHKLQQFNEQPLEDFHGLSPSQVQDLLDLPFEQQNILGWNQDIDPHCCDNTPLMRIYLTLKQQLANTEVKATAKGNLPRALVNHIYAQVGDLLPYTGRHFKGESINKEEDFRALNIVRLICIEAGLIKLHNKKFALTKIAVQKNTLETYQHLFEHYAQNYNWGYEDTYPAASFFYRCHSYALLRLSHSKNNSFSCQEFGEDIIDSFPAVVHEFEDEPYADSYSQACATIQLRLLERFWQLFGLVRLTPRRFNSTRSYKVEPLLEQLFWFKT